jgi:type I restriction enzyme S subunit
VSEPPFPESSAQSVVTSTRSALGRIWTLGLCTSLLDHDIRSLIHRAAGLIPGLTRAHILDQPALLPPLTEQRRIVEKVEALLARVNAARDRLAKVPAILKRFRQAVLAAACSGMLTKDWRIKNPNSIDSRSLLYQLREARRAAWEESERRRLFAKDKTVTAKQLRERYREPVAVDPVFEVPTSWTWASIDELTLLAGGLTKGQKRPPGITLRKVPYLRVANVQRGRLDLSIIKEIEATEDEIAELTLHPGDILLNEGGDIDKLGRGWVWGGEIGVCLHQNHVFRARPASQLIVPAFVSHYTNTFGQQFFLDQGAQTVNLASISMSKVRALPVPIPPVDEQREILSRVQALLTVAETVEGHITAASSQADRLVQAILGKAFRGELVPTDAELARQEGRDYEPASRLLERIRRERAPTARETSARREGMAHGARKQRLQEVGEGRRARGRRGG